MDEFKFEIGALVEHVTASMVGDGERAMVGVIVSQQAERCPGGIQNHYIIRWGLGKDYIVCNEVELRAHVPEVGSPKLRRLTLASIELIRIGEIDLAQKLDEVIQKHHVPSTGL